MPDSTQPNQQTEPESSTPQGEGVHTAGKLLRTALETYKAERGEV